MTSWPLEGVVLDPRAPQPLHAQLSSALRDRIQDRRLQPGDSLPSETQLQSHYGISRSVVRQALSTLAAEGAITRSRGRGSVVAPTREHHRLAHRAAGLSSQVQETGSAVGTQVLELRVEDSSPHTHQLGGDTVTVLERLRSIDGAPTAYIRTWLVQRYAAGLTAEELTDASLHQLLAERHGLQLVGGQRAIRAVAADDELAQLLQTPKGAPLLLLEGTTTDVAGEPVEVFSTWHRGDRIALELEVQSGERAEPRARSRENQQLQKAEETARNLAEQLRWIRCGTQ